MMALRYEWSWDVAASGSLCVKGTDNSGAWQITEITTGTYCHTDISTVVSGYSDFATALQTAINAASSETYTVTWNGTAGYTITEVSTGQPFNLTFSSFGSGVSDAAGTRLRLLLGFSGNLINNSTYSSDIRPTYLIIPAIQGRTSLSDEYEPDGIASESLADDGSGYMVSKDTSEILLDWVQVAEIETPPATFGADGTPPYKRQADAGTSADDVPWTYQHAWEHMRAGRHPFLVVDGGTSESAVCETRADGASFHPTRWTSPDYGLWSIPFKTRLLGRL